MSSEHDPSSADATPTGGGGLRLIRYGAFAAIAIALVAYPFIRHSRSSQTATQAEPQSGTAPRMPSAAEAAGLNSSLGFYQAGQYQQAIEAAKRALVANPDSAPAYNNIGSSWLQLKNYDEAEKALQTALRIDPGFELARNNLAWLARERAAAAAPPVDPRSYEGQINRSLASYQAGRYQESIDAAREALKANANSAEAYNNIAAGFAAMGKWDEAIPNAQQAIKLKPDFQLAKNNLAWALRGKSEAARK
jgi:tetratricopeptide (TPR) repeat protein